MSILDNPEPKPSIRERPLIIWTLVLAILILFTQCSSTEEVTAGEDGEWFDYECEEEWTSGCGNLPTTDIVNSPFYVAQAGENNVLFTVLTNPTGRTVNIMDAHIMYHPSDDDVRYVSGLVTIEAGGSQVLAFDLGDTTLTHEELEQLRLDQILTPAAASVHAVTWEDEGSIGHAQKLVDTYGPIAEAQLAAFNENR
ncbi:hypothetical protein [Jonesia quinghaiensis]|uniref:hypothetical protein n=1 Tax=Jonesia quinghaiensis TaxID=262806 RepID=UPI000424234B|nr:hypothetical protein [Jonesia quinghaiensis]